MDEQLLKEFLAEAEELIGELHAGVEGLRARRGEGRARRELLAQVFRHAHTVKGSAAAAGLAGVCEVAHEFESLLDAVRLGRAALDDAALDALEEAVGAVDDALRAAADGREQAAPAGLLARLRRLSEGDPGADEEKPAAERALPAEVADALSEQERRRLREAASEGSNVLLVEADFPLESFDEEFRQMSDALRGRGEIISTLPGAHESAPDRIRFRVVYASEDTGAQVAARVAPLGARVSGVDEEDAVGQSASPLSMQVRVPLEELDELVSAAHELYTDTALVLELAAASAGASAPEFKSDAERVRRRFVELEERLIGLRMVPLGATLERARRAARAAARAVGREVDFETAGGEVRIDRSLAERLADPLLHLLRNAVHHGVEPEPERLASGKAARGRVRVEASGEAGLVTLRVSDDGRGIDPERVARAARARGLVGHGAEVTQGQALRLIFRPGFSTAESVTSASGRGVGLDVVERAVEQVGGQLRVWSEPGRGATFEMRLPTTLALVHALLVSEGGERYCIDAGHVVDAGPAVPDDFTAGGGRALLRWRGTEVPLVTLRGLLWKTEAGGVEEGRAVAVVIARAEVGGARHVAVAVDGVEGRRDVLVRGLGRHAARWRGVSGATELPDGAAALVLDLRRLLEARVSVGVRGASEK